MQNTAKQILELIDLTSLNDSDNKNTILSLCNKSITPIGNVAAVCIYSHWITTVREFFAQKMLNLPIATVVNFPHGSIDLDRASLETDLALERGADEIDLVLPYHALIDGDTKIAKSMVDKVRRICGNKILKVIIESGELSKHHLIETASLIAIDSGADFLKTSTGKVKVNATLEAAEIMLNTIKSNNKKCGFKASGGIKTYGDAKKYLGLAVKIMGEDWVSRNTFRFGASSLVDDVLRYITI